MKIAVTGATGFIGSHFTRQALEAGHTVLAIRRSSKSSPPITFNRQPLWLSKSLEDVEPEDLQGYDVLVHFAAHTANLPYDDLLNCLRWNLMAVVSLFESARVAGIKRYIIAGSCFEYGSTGESYDSIPSNANLQPTNSYSASKAAASIALSQWANEHNLFLEILRVFHVYGEGEAPTRFWPSLKRAAFANENFRMTKGEQLRDFLPVEAVAATFLERSLYHVKSSNVQVFNLTSGEPCSLASFAQHWWRFWEAKGHLMLGELPYRPNEVMQYLPGAAKLTITSLI